MNWWKICRAKTAVCAEFSKHKAVWCLDRRLERERECREAEEYHVKCVVIGSGYWN
jgi:hypothetical protein